MVEEASNAWEEEHQAAVAKLKGGEEERVEEEKQAKRTSPWTEPPSTAVAGPSSAGSSSGLELSGMSMRIIRTAKRTCQIR